MIPVWESLDQAGVISRLIPGWEMVRSAPQRNALHRFTVDRHLVETAVQASALTRNVDRPDLLLVGALLHDIGKPATRSEEVIADDIRAGRRSESTCSRLVVNASSTNAPRPTVEKKSRSTAAW
jgi:[protein-PII] uridylyltransferase